jgi:hypothetical protein
MKSAAIATAAILLVCPVLAQDAPTIMDGLKQAVPAITLPDLASISGAVNTFTEDVAKSLPLLEQLGYEVSIFRIQWGLPPVSKLQLRSKGTVSPAKLQEVEGKIPNGLIANALLTSAITAKRIQNNMKLGTAVLDVDFAVLPTVRMSFRKSNDGRQAPDLDTDALYAVCAQLLN